jgi:hypothetical protein
VIQDQLETPSVADDFRHSPEVRAARSQTKQPVGKVVFRVAGLYGISRESTRLPLGGGHFIDSGQVCITLDPDSTENNLGELDYEKLALTVRYDAQLVFPGLYKLIRSGKHDSSLLNPVRVTATDQCKVEGDLSGWRALGCLEFLPGSIWAGATGG